MPDEELILAIDQGTSGSKAVVFSKEGTILSDGRAPLTSYFPEPGFVEQNPEEILSSVLQAVKITLKNLKHKGYNFRNIKCCGISNQRETFLLWDKISGKPLTEAIVWQCKRSVQICNDLKTSGDDRFLREKTGLFADPYFSGTKLIWLYRNNKVVRQKIDTGEACFGTVDTWLLFKLTSNNTYKTDYTNASRTLFFNLRTLKWDQDILHHYNLDNLNLPEPCPSGSYFGESDFNGQFEIPVPITGILGDSHAAAFGERCFEKGSAKATMGTGSSILLNTGELVESEQTSMVSTICWSTKNEVCYALEGIIISCGSTLTWISNQLGFFSEGKEADQIAETLDDNGGVYLIPAFSGLGAPWWKMNQKAQIHGLTFDSDKNHIVRAGLESIIFQVTDVIHAMEKDSGTALNTLQIDGGISASRFITDRMAELNTTCIVRCKLKEASAMGAALMAGLESGIYNSIEDIKKLPYNGEVIKSGETSGIKDSYTRWTSILQGL